MKSFYFILCLLMGVVMPSFAQQKPKKAGLPDINKIMSMTPEQQKKYAEDLQKQLGQQASEKSDEMNVSFDPSILPGAGVAMPVKNIKKLSSIPVTPPTSQQMLSQVSKMEAALKKMAAPNLVQEIEKFDAAHSAKEIQRASVGGWYANNPQASLMLNMKAVQKAPENVSSWNNLAAQYNMLGMEQYAVPILQNLLQQKPNSSVLLNNLGQAYLGMGDILKATEHLQRCLKIDDLHPEANRSMAMIKTHLKDVEAAARHFEKEMLVGARKSSLAQLRKNVAGKKFNLAALRKRKQQLDGTDNRNFFEEINLGEFRIPDLPGNTESAANWLDQHKSLLLAMQAEMLFWQTAALPDPEKQAEEGKRRPGMYHDLVDMLLSELGNDFSPLIALVREEDADHLMAITNTYYEKVATIVCPQPSNDRQHSREELEALQRKCCDMKKPFADAFVSEYNSYLDARIQIVQARWKEYINGMISIVQLDPSEGNKRMVYATVAEYFTFLITTMQAVKQEGPPMECHNLKINSDEADSILKKSNRDYKIECPSWLKIKMNVKMVKISADCESFNVEADVYEIINVGAEKKFKTGTSTLYVGAGVDGTLFKDILSAEVSQQFYIVFDNNNQFADLGMRGGGSFDIASGLFGENFTYDFSMNSGFSNEYTASSGWLEKFEKYLGYLPK